MPTAYVTAPDDAADDLATTLVEERLAACVNAVDCRSTYRWDGGVETDAETILLIKTTDEGYDRLEARIEELHPYDVPCIERFDEADALDRFASWIDDSVD
jgi:periplasmic divalent cation tolerance protein